MNSWDYGALGSRLEKEHPEQAYLCWENALFYAEAEQELEADASGQAGKTAEEAKEHLQALRAAGILLPLVSIVILNYKNKDLIADCVNSIRAFTAPSMREIVVVDNASGDDSTEWLEEQRDAEGDIILVENKVNRGFPGGCNDGIAAASPENDILLLNSDTVMMPDTLFTLRMALYEDPRNGAAGPMTTNAPNGQKIREKLRTLEDCLAYAERNRGQKPEYKVFLVGFCLLLKRTALEQVTPTPDKMAGLAQEQHDRPGDAGLNPTPERKRRIAAGQRGSVIKEWLDERFSPGNYEDNDLGLRMLRGGYFNILCHDSFLVHYGHQGFGKNRDAYWKLLDTNRRKLNEKYRSFGGSGLASDRSGIAGSESNVTNSGSGIAGGSKEGICRRTVSSCMDADDDLIDLIDRKPAESFRLLQIGCGLGADLDRIAYRFPEAELFGMEPDPLLASMCRGPFTSSDNCHELCSSAPFDYIILKDIAAEWDDPIAAISGLRKWLRPEGKLLLRLPNSLYWNVLRRMLKGTYAWDLENGTADAGACSYQIRHIITAESAAGMLKEAGFSVEKFRLSFPAGRADEEADVYDEAASADAAEEARLSDEADMSESTVLSDGADAAGRTARMVEEELAAVPEEDGWLRDLIASKETQDASLFAADRFLIRAVRV